jgi:hypothetical protein
VRWTRANASSGAYLPFLLALMALLALLARPAPWAPPADGVVADQREPGPLGRTVRTGGRAGGNSYQLERGNFGF